MWLLAFRRPINDIWNVPCYFSNHNNTKINGLKFNRVQFLKIWCTCKLILVKIMKPAGRYSTEARLKARYNHVKLSKPWYIAPLSGLEITLGDKSHDPSLKKSQYSWRFRETLLSAFTQSYISFVQRSIGINYSVNLRVQLLFI